MFFPIALLQSVNVLRRKNSFFTEHNYSSELAFIFCPTCKVKGFLYKSVFICCFNCMNLFYSSDEMLNYLNSGENFA